MPWEARWFGADMHKHDALLKWFKSSEHAFVSEVRDDRYVFAPYSEDIGIKLRGQPGEAEGKKPPTLEIKWRRRTSGQEFSISEGRVVGVAEEWIKWSWVGSPSEANDGSVDLFAEFPKGPVVTMTKTRLLRRYEFSRKGVRSVEWIGKDKDGLSCEITEIRVKDKRWWSLGLEGFGTKNDKVEFQNAAKIVLKEVSVLLEKKDSYGYPRWIKNNFGDPLQF
jgi:hypothetical protein